MRILLDTNILIHREAKFAINEDIGRLFYWLDKVKAEKIIHSVSLEEIEKHKDERVRNSFSIKLENYNKLQTKIALAKEIKTKIYTHDKSENDRNDTILINEVFRGREDILISEDSGIHDKAKKLGISDSVYTIEQFVEKSTLEHPELIDYKVLAVKKELFGNINLDDPFFDSFKEDYDEFST